MQWLIGCDDELDAGMVEKDAQNAHLLLYFKCDLLFLSVCDEMAFQSVERGFGGNPKLEVVSHGASVASSVHGSPKGALD